MKPGRIEKSLRFSFMDGIFAAAMTGFTYYFWVPCAESLKVSALAAGIVFTLPQFLSALAQLQSDRLVDWVGSRLKLTIVLVAMQCASLVPLLFLTVVPESARYLLLLLSSTSFFVSVSMATPGWVSLMGDHLPPGTRATYFGWRNRLLQTVTFLCGILAGQILQHYRMDPLKGFTILFALALVSRIISCVYLTVMFDPPIRQRAGAREAEDEVPASFLKFIFTRGDSPFKRYVLFMGAFMFSVYALAPYFAVYMIRELHYSYAVFTYVTFSLTLASIVGVKIWGELADRFGAFQVIRATSLFIAVVPLLWMISPHPFYVLFLQLSSGFAWSGLELMNVTFVFGEVPSALRTRAASYLMAMNGIAIFLGSCAGGLLLKILPFSGSMAFMVLFAVGGILRISILAFSFKKLHEEDSHAPPVSSLALLYADALGIRPVMRTGRTIYRSVFPEDKA